jgi:CDK-activating kinase assembly factor MAT1
MTRKTNWTNRPPRKPAEEEESPMLLPSPMMSLQSISCPICKADSYLNKNLKLLVSTPCCHRMCESCVYRLYSQGAAPCPICGTTLKKTSFSEPLFEDLSAEKEYRTRKQVMKWFNKRREDFETLKDFNDYLEEVEDIIFNLINQIDVERTNARIEYYRRSNQEVILKNATRQTREDQAVWKEVEQEKVEAQRRKDAENQEIESERREQEKARANLVEELAKGDRLASDIVHEFRSRTTITLKKSSAKRTIAEPLDSRMSGLAGEPKRKVSIRSDTVTMDIRESRYSDYLDRFGRYELLNEMPFVALANDYDANHQFDHWKTDKSMISGGYIPREVYVRALEYAFAHILLPPL